MVPKGEERGRTKEGGGGGNVREFDRGGKRIVGFDNDSVDSNLFPTRPPFSETASSVKLSPTVSQGTGRLSSEEVREKIRKVLCIV